MSSLVLVAALELLAACGDDLSPSQAMDASMQTLDSAPPADGGSCSTSCETSLWPRLIVGVVEPLDASAPKVTEARAIDTTGKEWMAIEGGCAVTGRFVCSYSWFTSPSDRHMRIVIELADGTSVSSDVELSPFNRCARRIAYLQLSLADQTFAPVRYISPCLDAS